VPVVAVVAVVPFQHPGMVPVVSLYGPPQLIDLLLRLLTPQLADLLLQLVDLLFMLLFPQLLDCSLQVLDRATGPVAGPIPALGRQARREYRRQHCTGHARSPSLENTGHGHTVNRGALEKVTSGATNAPSSSVEAQATSSPKFWEKSAR